MLEIDSVKINFNNADLFWLNIALAMVMFGVALNITITDFKLLFKSPKLILAGIVSQFILLPFVTYILVILWKPEPSIALGMMLVAACPGGNISNFFTHLAKGNTALSISLTAFATFMALVLTPFNFQFYGNLYQPTASILKRVALNPWELIKVVVILLGIPLIIGMFFRNKFPNASIRLSKLLKPISIVVFIGIVIVAFSNNLDVFNTYIMRVFKIGVTHNLLAIVLGLVVAMVLKLSFKDKKTLAIETGIQNSGLGLLLIFTFFDGLGGMALIAAFWGLWHIVSGLVLSGFWAYTSK